MSPEREALIRDLWANRPAYVTPDFMAGRGGWVRMVGPTGPAAFKAPIPTGPDSEVFEFRIVMRGGLRQVICDEIVLFEDHP